MKGRALLLAAVLAVTLTYNADGAISRRYNPSQDGAAYSEYPNGDKPIEACAAPTGWTEANTGDGFGEFCEDDAGPPSTQLASVGGSSSIQKMHYAYQAIGATGDKQIKARIVGDLAGNLVSMASLGIGFRDGADNDDFFHQIFGPFAGQAAVQSNSGTTAADAVNVNGAPGQSLPRWICAAFDDSAGTSKVLAGSDGVSFSEVATVSHDFSGGRVYFFGQSKSAVATLQGTIDGLEVSDTIDCYTPDEEPPVGTPPVLVSPIPNQEGTQGVAFSLDFRSFFTGATSYSIEAMPGALTESSDGVVSGTPNATDVSASPYERDLCATNADGTTCDAVQFFFSPASGSGSVFTIPDVGNTTNSLLNCASTSGANGSTWTSIRTSGSNTRPLPGDTLLVTSGERGNTEFRQCVGTASAPILVRKTASATRLQINAQGTDGLLFRDSEHVVADFTLNWTGHTSGCGADATLSDTPLTDCGLLIVGDPQFAIKWRGRARNFTIRGIEADGNWPGTAVLTGGDVAISPNDQVYCVTPGSEWRENIVAEELYLHDFAKEIIYFGPNVNYGQCTGSDDVPRLRNITLRNIYADGGGWDGINLKSARQGTNLMTRIIIKNIGGGTNAGGANSRGISCYESQCEITNSRVDTTTDPPGGAAGIVCGLQFAPTNWCGTSSGDQCVCNVSGVVVHDTDGNGIAYAVGPNADETLTGDVEFSTIVRPGGNAVNMAGGVASCAVHDVVAAKTSGNSTINAGPCSTSNNSNTQIDTQGFTNAAADDFTPTSGSKNRNAGQTGCPSEDLHGTTRPKGGTCDRGAIERDE